MTQYVQDKKTGKMRGSIGDGKTRIPTASVQQTLPMEDTVPTDSVPQLYGAFKEKVEQKQIYVYPYTYEEYSAFAVSALDSVGGLLVASKENSFSRSGIVTLSGRNQSTVFEEEFAIPYLTDPRNQAKFKRIIEEAVGDSKFVFIKFREPRENSADPNVAEDLLASDDPEALKLLETPPAETSDTTRAWADLFLVAAYEERTVYFPINIKCSSDNSYDNTASWQAASFVVFNDSKKGRSREAFYTALQQGEIAEDAVNDYFFWNFSKGDPAVGDQLCTDSVVCSYLEFPDPADKVFRANTSQSFPLQVNTSKVAEARAEQSQRPKKDQRAAKKDSTRKLTLGIVGPEREKAVNSLADTTAAELVISGVRSSISEEEKAAKLLRLDAFARELFSTPDMP